MNDNLLYLWDISDCTERAVFIKEIINRYPSLLCATIKGEHKCSAYTIDDLREKLCNRYEGK